MKFYLTWMGLCLSALGLLSAAPTPEKSAIRVTSQIQGYSPGQPWQKLQPKKITALGIYLDQKQVITTADVVADATYLEFSNADETRRVPAKLLAVDYESNLALLGLKREQDQVFFAKCEPVKLAPEISRGKSLQVWQLSDSGLPLISDGIVQNVDLASSFLNSHYFLTYVLKSSLQGSSHSHTLPVMHEGQLAGLLTSYDSEDQLAEVLASPIIHKFLQDARDGEYQGFPQIGLRVSETVDPFFRKFLGLDDNMGGLYIARVQPHSIAEKAGLQKADVLLAVDGIEVDRRGYYQDPTFDRLYWSHLVRGRKGAGETVHLTVLRAGKKQEIKMILDAAADTRDLVPEQQFGQAPRYLVHGGLIFQELSLSYLKAMGEEWATRAPLELLKPLHEPEPFEARGVKRVVILSGVIPTPATLGYERLGGTIVHKINGKEILDFDGLLKAIEEPNEDGIHHIEIEAPPCQIFLDEELAIESNENLKQRGLLQLSR